MDFAVNPSGQLPVLPKRRETRLPATLNIRVLGIDAHGKAFHQAAVTVDISLSGARINGLSALLNPGDIIGVQSGGEKCRFRVAWVFSNRDGTYQVGLHCLEKGTSPWRDRLQKTGTGDRRTSERYPCNGSVSLRAASFTTPIWGTMRDIGMGGCYVQSVNVVPPGEIVSGQFILNGVQINGIAEVRSSRSTVGMGLVWCDLGWDGQEKLNNLLRVLSLSHNEQTSSKLQAISQLEKLHQLVAALRERLENTQTLVDVRMIGRLSDAQEKLAEVLKSVQQ